MTLKSLIKSLKSESMTTILKKCWSCKENKPIAYFGKDGTRADGLNHSCSKCANIRNAKWRKENKEKYYQKQLRHIRKYPLKTSARVAVREALKKGVITKGKCADCGIEKVHAHHHKGYDKKNWLEITWLCNTHHLKAHKRI